MKPKLSSLTLVVHPTSRGFGWVLFEGDLVPVDWGIASARGDRSEQCIARFERLLDQYKPSALILESSAKKESRRRERIRILVDTMVGLAASRDITISRYTRTEVSKTVAGRADARRHQVADAVAERFPIFQHRLPGPRKIWKSEDGRQCLFDAAALGITHHRVTRPRP